MFSALPGGMRRSGKRESWVGRRVKRAGLRGVGKGGEGRGGEGRGGESGRGQVGGRGNGKIEEKWTESKRSGRKSVKEEIQMTERLGEGEGSRVGGSWANAKRHRRSSVQCGETQATWIGGG